MRFRRRKNRPLGALPPATLGAGMLGSMGLIAGLWAEKFDQIATFQNFVVMPMTFLAGVFYSVQGLPEIWQRVSHLNPLFYLVDGFRYGFFGTSDVAPWISASIAGIGVIVVCAVSLHLLRIGYKIRQ
jgi:ABC-2 type transport system permease protein